MGNPVAQAEAHYQLGNLCEAQGKSAKAVPFYTRAEALLLLGHGTPLLAQVRAALERLRSQK
jgi:hypothetical protein